MPQIKTIYLCLLQTFLFYYCLISAKSLYLFGVTPEKALLGVKMDSGKLGVKMDSGKHQHKDERGKEAIPITIPVEEIAILKDLRLISFDSSSNFLLLEHNNGLIEQTALCEDGLFFHKSLLNSTSLVYLQDGEDWICYDGKVTTFALYRSKLYFIVIGEFESTNKGQADKGKYSTNTTTRIELRVMLDCYNCPAVTEAMDFESLGVFKSPYLFNCSKRIAEIYNSARRGDADVKLKSGHSLKIVQDEFGSLSFFFQVFVARHYTTSEYQFVDLDLYHATDKGTVQLLHTERIPKHYARWKINGVGGVDYHRGVLCWTAADRIFCGQFRNGMLYDTTMALYPGDSVSLGICKGNRPNLLPILTGLVIVDITSQYKSLIVGCYSQWIGLGGSAQIIIPHDERQLKEVYPLYLSHSGESLKIGSLFATYNVSTFCQKGDLLSVCEEGQNRDSNTNGGKRKEGDNVMTFTQLPINNKQKQGDNNKKHDTLSSNSSTVVYDIASKPKDVPYTRVHLANNKTAIKTLDYSDLYDSNRDLTKQDEQLLHEKGIGVADNSRISRSLFFVTFSMQLLK